MPDLRNDFRVLLEAGDQRFYPHTLATIEGNTIVNSVNTLRDQILRWREQQIPFWSASRVRLFDQVSSIAESFLNSGSEPKDAPHTALYGPNLLIPSDASVVCRKWQVPDEV